MPDTLYYSDDESIIGSEFYVMRKVEGKLIAGHGWPRATAPGHQFSWAQSGDLVDTFLVKTNWVWVFGLKNPSPFS